MGSPRQTRHSKLRYSEGSGEMRQGSVEMDPCRDASPSKQRNNSDDAAATSAFPDPSTATKDAPSDASALDSSKEARSPDSAASESSQQQSSPVKRALHDGLSIKMSSSSTSSNSNNNEKSPSHSAASSRTRRPFFLSRLSSSAGSKHRRETKQRQRELRQQQQRRRRQSDMIPEGRHPEESIASETDGSDSSNARGSNNISSPSGGPAFSPTTTVLSTKSSASGGKRRKGKPSIKFLRRALSSPPILLQRFHSNPTSEISWQENKDAIRRGIPHIESSSSSGTSSVDLNPSNMVERTRVIPKSFSPTSKRKEFEKIIDTSGKEEETQNKSRCNATSILHHSYLPVLDTLCGTPKPEHLRDSNQFSGRILPPSDVGDIRNRYIKSLSEDPTVQESIECIFASQLEDGLKLWDEEYGDDDDDEDNKDNSNRLEGPPGHRDFEDLEQVKSSSFEEDGLVSPAAVQQSRMNRKDRKDSSKSLFANMSQTKKRYEQASLVYVGTFDPNTPRNRVPSMKHLGSGLSHIHNISFDKSFDVSTVYSNLPTDPLPCACNASFLPTVEPKDWPQAPIAIRPTPGSGTIVKAIRFSNPNKYPEPLWVPGSHMTWSQRLEQHWGRETEEEQRRKRDQQPHYACCETCVICPINNGNEAPGQSLVIDFESELFEGSLLLRMRYTEGTTPEPYDDAKGYFQGMNRRYQLCIRGRFKKVIPFTEMTSGFRLDRKFGKMPSKWMMKGALKVVSFFAPQLDIKIEGVDQPYSITPLGSTPQCINVDDGDVDETACWYDHQDNDPSIHNKPKESSVCCNGSDKCNMDNCFLNTIEDSNVNVNPLEGLRVESSLAHRNILKMEMSAKDTTSLQRAKIRKKAFDKLYVQKSLDPKTDPSKTYTFEFLQHMLNFQEFSVELGSMLGSLKLEDLLDGQPLPIMAAHGDIPLWSFDIWNECLWKQAINHDAMDRKNRHQQKE